MTSKTVECLNNNEKQCDKKRETVQKMYSNQYLISLAVSLMAVNSGMSMGWISTTLPKLTSEVSPIIITTYQGSWLVSLLEVGSLIGSIIATFTLDHVGRKSTLLIATVPTMVSAILYATARNVNILFIGRVLSGVTVGASRSTIFLYISEISSPEIRGTLSSLMFTQLNIGLLLQFVLGSYLSIQINSLVLLIIPILFLFTFIWVPESPYYYLIKDDLKSARKSIEILRRTKHVDNELKKLDEFVQNDKKIKKNYWQLLKLNKKPFLIVFGLISCLKLSGIGIIMSYVQVIFQQVDTTTSPQLNSIIVVSSVFLSSWICTYFIDKWGRRPLFLISCVGVAVSLFTIGIYFYLKSINFLYLNRISYLPIISLLMFKIFESIGIGPITHICITELFPTNVKTIAVCITRVYQSISLCIVIQVYHIIINNYNLCIIFWVFSFFSIFSAFFVLYYLPETKNKSLSEIQECLK